MDNGNLLCIKPYKLQQNCVALLDPAFNHACNLNLVVLSHNLYPSLPYESGVGVSH